MSSEFMFDACTKCPFCEVGNLTPITWSGVFLGTTVSDLEGMKCDTCKAEPILTDQIKRNQIRIDVSRCSPIDEGI